MDHSSLQGRQGDKRRAATAAVWFCWGKSGLMRTLCRHKHARQRTCGLAFKAKWRTVYSWSQKLKQPNLTSWAMCPKQLLARKIHPYIQILHPSPVQPQLQCLSVDARYPPQSCLTTPGSTASNPSYTSASHRCSDNTAADRTLFRPTGLFGLGHLCCIFTRPTRWLTAWFLMGSSFWRSRILTQYERVKGATLTYHHHIQKKKHTFSCSSIFNCASFLQLTCCPLLPAPSRLLPSGFSLISFLTMLSFCSHLSLMCLPGPLN